MSTDKDVYICEKYGLTEEQLQDMKASFALFDKDGNGFIDKDELRKVMQCMGQNPTAKEVDDLIKEMDNINADGKIEFEEFVAMSKQTYKSKEEQVDALDRAFRVFDIDGNGRIDLSELKKVMQKLGEKLSDEEIKEMMAEVDVNGDGYISKDEFINKMLN